MTHSCRTGHDAATAALRRQAEIMAANARGVDAMEVDAIHDMRVASRRLRMALRVYRPWLPKNARKGLAGQARRVTLLLGKRRELDVMLVMLREHREETHGIWTRFMDHLIDLLEARRADQAEFCREAVAIVEDPAFGQIAGAILEGIEADDCVLDLARRGLKEALRDARDTWRRWKKRGNPEDLHEVRIALKHLRYACEFHRDLYGSAMDEWIALVKEAQSLLGEWNECRLLEEMVLAVGNAADYSLAQGAPLVAEAYGTHAAELADQFGALGKALLGREGRRAFSELTKAPAVVCCANVVVEE